MINLFEAILFTIILILGMILLAPVILLFFILLGAVFEKEDDKNDSFRI